VNRAPSILALVQCIIGVLVEMSFVGMTIRYVITVSKGSEKQVTQSRRGRKRMFWCIRMFLLVVFQFIPRITFDNQYFRVASDDIPPEQITYTSMSFLTMSYIMSATVVLIGNKQLRRWVKEKLSIFKSIDKTESAASLSHDLSVYS